MTVLWIVLTVCEIALTIHRITFQTHINSTNPPIRHLISTQKRNPSSKRGPFSHIIKENPKDDATMTRLLLFLTSYGLIVVTISNMILYFNYRSLGYEWNPIFQYILSTADFKLFVLSVIVLILTVYVPVPSRPPFSQE